MLIYVWLGISSTFIGNSRRNFLIMGAGPLLPGKGQVRSPMRQSRLCYDRLHLRAGGPHPTTHYIRSGPGAPLHYSARRVTSTWRPGLGDGSRNQHLRNSGEATSFTKDWGAAMVGGGHMMRQIKKAHIPLGMVPAKGATQCPVETLSSP